MAPYIVILACAIIGLFLWGVKGLILGAILGYVLTVLFGLSLMGISGGILPRPVRRDTARSFLRSHPEIVEELFPDARPSERQKLLEQEIERIIRTGIKLSPALDPKGGYRSGDVQIAVDTLVEQEVDSLKKKLLVALGEHIQKEWY